MPKITRNITIENARIGFRNFAGKEGKFNAKGRRNFCVFLEKGIATELEAEGWKIKWLTPRDPDEDSQAILQVAVSFAQKPPRIVLMSSTGKTVLDEESVSVVDFAEIESVDVLITPYNWDVNGKTGTSAYLKTMYITIFEDALEKKYLDVPDSAAEAIGGCGNCEACDGSCGHGH